MGQQMVDQSFQQVRWQIRPVGEILEGEYVFGPLRCDQGFQDLDDTRSILLQRRICSFRNSLRMPRVPPSRW